MKDLKLLLTNRSGKIVMLRMLLPFLNDGSGRYPLQFASAPLQGTVARAFVTKPVVSLCRKALQNAWHMDLS